jgi:acetyl-CoA carboxylase carboxyltransferase component
MPGEEQEHNGLLQAGASLCQSIQTRVPRFSVVIRKCYGAAAYLMMQTKAQGGNGVLALETARIAIMGYEAAKNMFSDKFQVFSEAEYFKKYEDPQIALQAKIVDEIVKKNEIREKLISLISTHNYSRENLNNSREHLIIP